MTIGLQNLSNQNFYKVKSIVPPLSEQISIINYVGHIEQSYNRLIAVTEREISLMQEYRTRLIADVVTGKVDVRRPRPESGRYLYFEITKARGENTKNSIA
jgi:type I restriction enzyme S subunit